MDVLARAAIAAIALAGCYAPPLVDCTVTCHGAGECATGQVCGSDGYCAAPAAAGTCGRADAHASIDAPDERDASIDGSTDATVAAQLHVTITGKGEVEDSTATLTCKDNPGDCLFDVDAGAMITLTAVATTGHPFMDWTTANCAGMGATCTVTIVAPVTTVGAKFK